MSTKDVIANTRCACCGVDLRRHRETGVSGLYNPNGPSLELCKPCWDTEQDVIESMGRNRIPERLAHYQRVLQQYEPDKTWEFANEANAARV